MPTRFNASETRNDARDVAERLGIGFRELAIEELRLAFATGASRGRRVWPPRTCRRASAA